MNTLTTYNLTIGYSGRKQDKIIASGLNLSLASGELVCLLGPNGAGKSTLMRTLAGMQTPLSGQVSLNDENVHELSARQLAQLLSVVLTERPNVGMLTGYELVALGRHPYTDFTGRLDAHDVDVINWALNAVGASDIAGEIVTQLSDGQRQKLMIARALAQEPQVILLDEPTAFLDLPRRVETMRVLGELAHRTGRAVLLSTHDLDLALRTADRIWLLSSEGMMHIGAPEDLILNGAFQRVFDAEGVAFDLHTGAFKIQTGQDQQVRLNSEANADNLHLIWTQRALERAGFQVSDDAKLCVCFSDNPPRWQVDNYTYHTLYALIEVLRNEMKP